MRSVRIKITGKVQGVFFRASTKETADKLGIKGFVRNEHDGSVYIEAEGDEKALQTFTAWCGQGPSRAEVENVNIEEGPVNNFDAFKLQY